MQSRNGGMGGIKSCHTQPGEMAPGMNGSGPNPLLGPLWSWGLVSTGHPEPWPGMEDHSNQNLRMQQLGSESFSCSVFQEGDLG